jgi:hypothetical protein
MSSNKVVRVSYTQDEESKLILAIDKGIPNKKFKPIEAEVKKTCGEPGSLNFLFGIPLSMAKISDDEEEEDEDSEDEEEQLFDACLCGNICSKDHLCGHGVAAGVCCVCQECYNEMEAEEEDEV